MLRCTVHNLVTDERYAFEAPDQAAVDAKLLAKEKVYGRPAWTETIPAWTDTSVEPPVEHEETTVEHPSEREVVTTDITAEVNQAEAIKVVQARLDTHAQSWGYDNIFTACTYADEPAVPQFQAEGQVLRAWRSATWAVCYAHADAPSLDALLALLPALPARPS